MGTLKIICAPAVVDRLRAMRGPGDSYSDVILKLAAEKKRA
jgi:predicted CopG family antitoxin